MEAEILNIGTLSRRGLEQALRDCKPKIMLLISSEDKSALTAMEIREIVARFPNKEVYTIKELYRAHVGESSVLFDA